MPLFLYTGMTAAFRSMISNGALSSALPAGKHISSWRSLTQLNFRVRSLYVNHKVRRTDATKTNIRY
jgi:hypothetical protein